MTFFTLILHFSYMAQHRDVPCNKQQTEQRRVIRLNYGQTERIKQQQTVCTYSTIISDYLYLFTYLFIYSSAHWSSIRPLHTA